MAKNLQTEPHPASFRDPSGFLFRRNGRLYRQVNESYAADYDAFIDTGLYNHLVEEAVLLSHEERDVPAASPEQAYKILEPVELEFISYPYEWCFSQLKDAALTTLRVQREALGRGMTLKDASAFNIQFQHSQPLLIDSLSFEKLNAERPWTAYRQFCRHFLAPLALMSYVDVELGKMMRTHIDGIPLNMASSLLPRRTWLRVPLLVHIHWHAAAERRYSRTATKERSRGRRMGISALLGLVDNLEGAVRRLKWSPDETAWADYETIHAYSEEGWREKHQLVEKFLDQIEPRSVWDLGANVGTFSRLASQRGTPTVAFDFDAGAVELNYRRTRAAAEDPLLPLVMDLTNPSPALGWEHRERLSLEERGPADAILALALIHHLAISNNLPLSRVAEFLSRLCQSLLIEFVPKEDPQAQRLLSSRKDIFDQYSEESFESAFNSHFQILGRDLIADSGRSLYRMKRRA